MWWTCSYTLWHFINKTIDNLLIGLVFLVVSFFFFICCYTSFGFSLSLRMLMRHSLSFIVSLLNTFPLNRKGNRNDWLCFSVMNPVSVRTNALPGADELISCMGGRKTTGLSDSEVPLSAAELCPSHWSVLCVLCSRLFVSAGWLDHSFCHPGVWHQPVNLASRQPLHR